MTTAPANEARTARRFRRWQWITLLATMFCYLFYYTGRQTFGFAIPGIERELGLSKEALGWVSAALLWSYAIGQAINGNLGDRFGGRRMMSLGAALSCGLNWLVSFATGLVTLIVPWGLNGYAQSMGWAPGSRVLSNWWPVHERGKAYGFYVFAAGMSSVLAFTMSLVILDVLALDWRWIFRLPVLLLLFGGAVYFLIARDRPEELGLTMDRDDASAGPPRVASEGPGATNTDAGAPAETSLERYAAVLREWRFLIASAAIGFQNLARYGLLVWVPVHFLGASHDEDPAGKWLSIALPVGMAFGALTNGWLSDRLFRSRRSPTIVLFMALAALASLAMYFVPVEERALGIVVLFLCGFFAYGPQSSFWALAPDLLGHTRAGTGTGIMNTSAYVLAGLGEPLIGWAIERHDETALVFPIVAAACGAGACISIFIRR